MRDPFYAGVLYPKSEKALREAIEACYLADRGPGAPPTRRRRAEPVRGILAPHSAIDVAGPCAAWSWAALAESGPFDVYIIAAYNLGSPLSGLGMRTYAMPMGEVRVDQPLARALVEKGTITYADNFHEHDHAIEVQLPWLQHAIGVNARVLALLLGDDLDLKQLAVDIKECLADANKRAALVVSGEFTHHGPGYNFLPFDPPVNEKLYEHDGRLIEHLKRLDLDGFVDACASGPCSIDAVRPIELAFHLLKPQKVLLEQYYTRADVEQGAKDIAAFASMLFV